MSVFDSIKENVTARQAAEIYGIPVNRYGMAVCPFHNDKNPSMKVDKRFHCFGCQADGDAVDFVSRLFGLSSKDAAMKLAADVGISYENHRKPIAKPHIREPTPEQKCQQEEIHCHRVLSDYYHLLQRWKKEYAPKHADEEWHPLFIEAVQQESYIEHLLDVLLCGSLEKRKELVIGQRKEVMKLEQRVRELSARSSAHRRVVERKPRSTPER